MIRKNEKGWEFESKNGKIYDLYIGYTLNSIYKLTNDICYIHDRFSGKLVNWFYGATHEKEYLENAIKGYVESYEEELINKIMESE